MKWNQDKQPEYAFQKAPRCTAKSKRTSQRCKAPAVRKRQSPWKMPGGVKPELVVPLKPRLAKAVRGATKT